MKPPHPSTTDQSSTPRTPSLPDLKPPENFNRPRSRSPPRRTNHHNHQNHHRAAVDRVIKSTRRLKPTLKSDRPPIEKYDAGSKNTKRIDKKTTANSKSRPTTCLCKPTVVGQKNDRNLLPFSEKMEDF
ncbi:hypothetical protein YC2023_094916 [Brassica napus]